MIAVWYSNLSLVPINVMHSAQHQFALVNFATTVAFLQASLGKFLVTQITAVFNGLICATFFNITTEDLAILVFSFISTPLRRLFKGNIPSTLVVTLIFHA
jgi:hypothetical protein